MASKNPRLAAARAEVLRLQRNAGKKISRQKSSHNAHLAHTKYDPRVPRERVNMLNEKQLAALAGRLQAFNSRTTQFVGIHGGTAVPRSDWLAYKAEETKLNAKRAERLNKIKDIPMPIGDETVGEATAKMTPGHASMANPAVNPYRPLNRNPKGVMSRKALRDLMRDLKKKQKSKWDDEEHKTNRDTFRQMITRLGDTEMADAVGALTPKQFYMLWHHTDFVRNLSERYELAGNLLDDEDKAWHEQVIEDAFADNWIFIRWAQKIK